MRKVCENILKFSQTNPTIEMDFFPTTSNTTYIPTVPFITTSFLLFFSFFSKKQPQHSLSFFSFHPFCFVLLYISSFYIKHIISLFLFYITLYHSFYYILFILFIYTFLPFIFPSLWIVGINHLLDLLLLSFVWIVFFVYFLIT